MPHFSLQNFKIENFEKKIVANNIENEHWLNSDQIIFLQLLNSVLEIFTDFLYWFGEYQQEFKKKWPISHDLTLVSRKLYHI